MTAQSHLLDRLGELRPADRAWVLNQLSGRERAALMEAARGEGESVSPSVAPQKLSRSGEATSQPTASQTMSSQIALVQVLPVEQVVSTLRAEPPWLIASILSIETWSWSRELMERLPPHVRSEVMRLREKPLAVAGGMRTALLALCAQKLAQSEVPKRSSRIRGLMERVQAKLLSRRLTLRL